jgi:hypothetical protein
LFSIAEKLGLLCRRLRCVSAQKVRSVPVRTAKELRDLNAAASQIGEWDKLGGEGTLSLNVLNVEGDVVCG